MQTFLPYEDFTKCAKCLDDKRLNNQINETLILLRTVTGWYTRRGKKGWPNHPAAQMWRGFEAALFWYGITMLEEYERRQGKVSLPRLENFLDALRMTPRQHYLFITARTPLPSWLGREDLISPTAGPYYTRIADTTVSSGRVWTLPFRMARGVCPTYGLAERRERHNGRSCCSLVYGL